MGFKEQLIERLEGKLNHDEMKKIPNGFQRVGDIIILNMENISLDKELIGKKILEMFPNIRSVCAKVGGIKGEFREPQIELIAGENNTITTHTENNCKYRFDVKKIMFAKGNVIERMRIANLVEDNEVIVDMFAGIGYFSVPIGKLSNPRKIYSIELNPLSFKFLEENLRINHIRNAVAFNEDCRKVIDKLVKKGIKVDRVIMGYLPPPKEFLKWAFKIIKKNGILHYEDLVNIDNRDNDIDNIINEVRNIAKENGRDIKLLFDREIKSYAPKIAHWVFDFKVN